MNDAILTRSMLISGVLFGVLTALPPFNVINYCTCCSLFAAAGFLAGYLLRKDSHDPVPLGRGAQAGLGAGFLGGLINSLFSIPVALLIRGLVPTNNELVQSILDNLGQDNAGLARILKEISAEGADAVAIFSSAWFFITIARSLVTVLFFSIFATLGGMLAIALLEKRRLTPAYVAPPQWTGSESSQPPSGPPPSAPPAENGG
jgi:hypothetical protein